MGNYDFNKDLENEDNCIKTVIAFLEAKQWKVMERRADYKYDLKVAKDNRVKTIEIKEDIMAPNTGNVAIEYQSRGKDSGITRTQSDYYMYKIKDKLHVIRTTKLKEAIANKLYFRTVNGGDADSNTLMYLFKQKVFNDLCESINQL